MKNIFTHANPSQTHTYYPALIAINETATGLEILVRSEGEKCPSRITLDNEQAAALAAAILVWAEK
jgi:hypothetical protein